MKYLEIETPESSGYIIPMSDIHIGEKGFEERGLKKLKGYIEWVRQRNNAFVFLNGDVFNVGGRQAKTSPFESNPDEYERAIDIFEPIKDRIIGATDGNHEARVMEEFGYSPTSLFCKALDIPYCMWSAVVRFKVGKRTNGGNRFNQNYFIYFHHTTGGGTTIGSKLNRVVKLREIIEGCDVYVGSHNHQLAVAPVEIFIPSMQGRRVDKRRVWYVDSGSYQDWGDTYAEQKGYMPTKLGSPRIRFDGREHHHDVHVSL